MVTVNKKRSKVQTNEQTNGWNGMEWIKRVKRIKKNREYE